MIFFMGFFVEYPHCTLLFEVIFFFILNPIFVLLVLSKQLETI